MKYIIFLFTLVLVSCSSSKQSTDGTSIDTSGNYEVDFLKAKTLSFILDRAEREEKLVYVDIGAKWCLPCQMMKSDVYTDKDIGTYMNDNFISYLVDAEIANGPDLATIFEVTAFPTLLFLDTKGRVLERKVGAAYHTELRRLGDLALAQRKLKL